jgi:hypothetical protein
VPPTLVRVKAGTPAWLPGEMCCNCGTTEGLEKIPVAIAKDHFFGATIVIGRVAHCAGCAPSASRVRPRFGSVAAAFGFLLLAGIALGAVVGHVVGGGPHLTDGQFVFAFCGGFLVALAATVWLYRPRTFAPPCTSYYQAVFVESTRRTLFGRVEYLVLGFSNPQYAKRVQERNSSLGPS